MEKSSLLLILITLASPDYLIFIQMAYIALLYMDLMRIHDIIQHFIVQKININKIDHNSHDSCIKRKFTMQMYLIYFDQVLVRNSILLQKVRYIFPYLLNEILRTLSLKISQTKIMKINLIQHLRFNTTNHDIVQYCTFYERVFKYCDCHNTFFSELSIILPT